MRIQLNTHDMIDVLGWPTIGLGPLGSIFDKKLANDEKFEVYTEGARLSVIMAVKQLMSLRDDIVIMDENTEAEKK